MTDFTAVFSKPWGRDPTCSRIRSPKMSSNGLKNIFGMIVILVCVTYWIKFKK